MRRVVVLVFLVAVLLLIAVSPSGADRQSSADGRPSEIVSQEFQIEVEHETGNGFIDVAVWYPARSAAEAQAAENDSLDTEWFRGHERVRTLFDHLADEDDEFERGAQFTQHHEDISHIPTNRDPEHGWVKVVYAATWRGFHDDGEDLRIDENYTAVLGPEWTLTVAIPSDWEPDRLNGSPQRRGFGQTQTSYQWNLSEEQEYPLLVVEDASHYEEGGDLSIPLGPTGGIGMALVAIALVATLLARRR